MGGAKREIKRIENKGDRQISFRKRSTGLMKKAHELAVLCDAQVGVIVFSFKGEIFEYCSPTISMHELKERYQKGTHTGLGDPSDNQQQLFCEVTKMRDEINKLQEQIRKFIGEDLANQTTYDLLNLEAKLQRSLDKIRNWKDQLMGQQIANQHHKVCLTEDQNSYLYRAISEQQQVELQLVEHNQHVPSSSRNTLQLFPQLPYRLQLFQPMQAGMATSIGYLRNRTGPHPTRRLNFSTE